MPRTSVIVPKGWWLVPEELTQEMVDAFWEVMHGESEETRRQLQRRWMRMIAAAPEPPHEIGGGPA